jgi:co-chaperonin GroES (HSP10)
MVVLLLFCLYEAQCWVKIPYSQIWSRSLSLRITNKDIPAELSRYSAIHDMILVERMSSPEISVGGIILPKKGEKDQKHVGVVVSVPSDGGLESDSGALQPIEKLAPYKVGDVVYIRDPWGVGPLHIELNSRFFSFHKAAHITGHVQHQR